MLGALPEGRHAPDDLIDRAKALDKHDIPSRYPNGFDQGIPRDPTLNQGLKAAPDYQLEELPTDVGRIDLFCFDAQSKYVVVELKAGVAGDDAIGQILGYMAWVRESVQGGETARGILVCRNATERIRAASKLIPDLRIKKYDIAFTFEDLA